MDAEIEPTTFDLVVVGTGLAESILAGAAAQGGKRVLHLDPGATYGAHWATLQPDALMEWAKNGGAWGSSLEGEKVGEPSSQAASASLVVAAADSNPEVVPVSAMSAPSPIFDVKCQVGGESAQISPPTEVSDELPPSIGAVRRYGVDLAGPRLALAAGPLINLLIQCGAHNYLEFKAIEGCYIWRNGQLESVPSSRADIFRSRSLSLVEKRHLTMFFKLVTEGGASDGAESISEEELAMPFGDFLARHKLPPSIRESLLYSVSLLERDQDTGDSPRLDTREGLRAVTAYLQSVGRFGTGVGAFLYPLYGCGELPQAFCRIAAVKGALYVLRRGIRALLLDKASRRLQGVVTSTGQQILTSKLVASSGLLEPFQNETASTTSKERNESGADGFRSFPQPSDVAEPHLCRCICVTDAPLTVGQSNVLVVFPPRSLSPAHPAHPVRVLQGGESAAICPPGRFLVQLSTLGSANRSAGEELQAAVEALFETQGGSLEGSEQGGEGLERVREADGRTGLPGARMGSDEGSKEGGVAESSRGTIDEQRSNSYAGASTPNESVRTGKAHDPATQGASRAEAVLAPVIERETGASEAAANRKPRLLWSVYFKQATVAGRELADPNVYQCSAPDASLTFDNVTKEAEQAFSRLFPAVPFFPPQALDGHKEGPEDEDSAD